MKNNITKPVVTGEMLHDAFRSVSSTALPWTHVSHEEMRNYGMMADHLNAALDLQAVCSAPENKDFVWSSSESGEETPRIEVESLVFLSRDEAEKIIRAFLQRVNGCVDESEVARILEAAGQVQA